VERVCGRRKEERAWPWSLRSNIIFLPFSAPSFFPVLALAHLLQVGHYLCKEKGSHDDGRIQRIMMQLPPEGALVCRTSFRMQKGKEWRRKQAGTRRCPGKGGELGSFFPVLPSSAFTNWQLLPLQWHKRRDERVM